MSSPGKIAEWFQCMNTAAILLGQTHVYTVFTFSNIYNDSKITGFLGGQEKKWKDRDPNQIRPRVPTYGVMHGFEV